jgi:predicted DNA-binding protein
MSKLVSAKLQDETFERLNRVAQVLGKTPGDTVATLVEESLREIEFADIEFRNSCLGRQAFMKSSSLAVWEVIQIAKGYGMDALRVANHFERSVEWVKAAFNYAEAYPEEIGLAIQDTQSITEANIRQLLPNLEVIVAPPGEA